MSAYVVNYNKIRVKRMFFLSVFPVAKLVKITPFAKLILLMSIAFWTLFNRIWLKFRRDF